MALFPVLGTVPLTKGERAIAPVWTSQ
jgi:hypothetical protein